MASITLDASDRSDIRFAVKRFLLMGLAALVLIATPVAFWIHAASENHALNRVVGSTQRLADNAVAPMVTEEVLAGDPEALRELDERLQPWLEEGSVLRFKIWNADGRIIYSDVAPLIGQQFEFADTVGNFGSSGLGIATLGVQNQLENEYEAEAGELVEVYVQLAAANGQPLVFEAYYDDEDVREMQLAVLLGVAPASVLALAALQLAQLVPAIRLARRVQSDQARKRQLLERAIDASELERQRIGRDLHGEIIQDLAGLSYAMESEEMRGSADQSPLFNRARSILQNDIRTLVAMTGNLDPSDLREAGLQTALSRLAEKLTEQGIGVILNLEENLNLDADQAALFYRVARETLANVAEHANARTVEVSLRGYLNRTELLIRDDGSGFDPEACPGKDAMGLKIIRSTVSAAGGSLEVSSGTGTGTCLIVSLPAVEQRC
ncbi:sensor histidine kinase [Arthrobacter monumenti]